MNRKNYMATFFLGILLHFFVFPVFCLIWLVFFVLSSSQWGLADLIVCRDREMNDAHRNMSFSKQK